MGLTRQLGLALNRCFSWNATLSSLYLQTWARALEFLPDGSWLKQHIGNNLQSSRWPAMELPGRLVEWGSGVRGLLTPRPGSLGFRALYEQRVTHEAWVFDFLGARFSRYDAVLEVGANIGLYTVFFSKLFARRDGRLRVFSFEPSPRAFRCLEENLALNDCANVMLFPKAVSATAGTADFHENPVDFMKGSLDRDAAGQFEGLAARPIEVGTLSGKEIAPLLASFSRILLKVDVVGSEPEVLASLGELLEQKRPDIVVGVWAQNLPGLNRLGLEKAYRIYRIDPGELLVRPSFTDTAYCNYFLEAK